MDLLHKSSSFDQVLWEKSPGLGGSKPGVGSASRTKRVQRPQWETCRAIYEPFKMMLHARAVMFMRKYATLC